MKMRFAILMACVAGLSSLQALATGLENETLLQPLASGFKPGWSASRQGMDMTEFVVPPETVDNWMRLITTQVFHGKGDEAPNAFIQRWGSGMASACPALTRSSLVTGLRNGYPVTIAEVNCPRNPATNRPEVVVIEALQGKDALYSVQSAFRYQPSRNEMAETLAYLKSIEICDTRAPEHPCPAVTPLQPNGK